MEPKSNLLRSLMMKLCRNGLKLTAATTAEEGATGTWAEEEARAEKLDFLNQILVQNKIQLQT